MFPRNIDEFRTAGDSWIYWAASALSDIFNDAVTFWEKLYDYRRLRGN